MEQFGRDMGVYVRAVCETVVITARFCVVVAPSCSRRLAAARTAFIAPAAAPPPPPTLTHLPNPQNPL